MQALREETSAFPQCQWGSSGKLWVCGRGSGSLDPGAHACVTHAVTAGSSVIRGLMLTSSGHHLKSHALGVPQIQTSSASCHLHIGTWMPVGTANPRRPDPKISLQIDFHLRWAYGTALCPAPHRLHQERP